MAELDDLAARWRSDLESWAIPADILAAAPSSPWELPRELFLRRARHAATEPAGLSYRTAMAALGDGGEVLDVGAGAGAAGLAVASATTHLTAVDADPAMLELLRGVAAEFEVAATTVEGRWPEVAATVPAADVVLCHHVLYNVPDLVPFLTALTEHARREVVVELTADHPLTPLNPLWLRMHGIERPDHPTAGEVQAILLAMGINPQVHVWRRPSPEQFASTQEQLASTAARLCLPPERIPELVAVIAELDAEGDWGWTGGGPRHVVVLNWHGSAT